MVCAITSLTAAQAQPAGLARIMRGHWASKTGCTASRPDISPDVTRSPTTTRSMR